jgi:hypothetical protein
MTPTPQIVYFVLTFAALVVMFYSAHVRMTALENEVRKLWQQRQKDLENRCQPEVL